MDSNTLAPGCKVKVFGLEAQPHYNNTLGTVVEYVASKDRWKVQLDQREEREETPKFLSVKATHLCVGVKLTPEQLQEDLAHHLPMLIQRMQRVSDDKRAHAGGGRVADIYVVLWAC